MISWRGRKCFLATDVWIIFIFIIMFVYGSIKLVILLVHGRLMELLNLINRLITLIDKAQALTYKLPVQVFPNFVHTLLKPVIPEDGLPLLNAAESQGGGVLDQVLDVLLCDCDGGFFFDEERHLFQGC